MALPVNIVDLIHQRVVESTRIEYKTDWNPESIVHSITAFANDFDNLGGGYVIVGIEEKNGRPVFPVKGLDPDAIDGIEKDILNKCNLIEPRYIPVVEPALVDEKDVLVLWVPGGDDRPYKCPEKIYIEKNREKSEKVYYIRKTSNTVKANYLEERELIGLARNVPFDDRANPITVTITPECIEILSLPGPDRSISDDDLENRVLISSRYRNRRIGDFLKELKMVEGRNTGIPLIVNAMKSNGSALPIFKTDEDRSYFRVVLPIHTVFLNRKEDNAESNSNMQKGSKRRNKDEIKLLLLDVLEKYGDMSMGELSTELGYKKLNDTIRKAIKELLDSGEVHYLYPDKPNSRNQKICLSE